MQNTTNHKKLQQLTIEVAYAAGNSLAKQVVISLQVAIGMNIKQAIEQSGILTKFPEIDLNVNPVGVFGQLRNLTTVLQNGDRIEIYRSLLLNPNQIRQSRGKNK